MRKKLFVIFLCVFLITACSSQQTKNTVNYVQAKEKIINEGAILLDVRTQEEYDSGHIDGALLLTLDNIDENTAKDVIGDKNQIIIVYCRSGNRSSQAVNMLKNLGYTQVYDLGSMSNWRE